MNEVISRAKAKALGLKHYFTGKPCRHGHLARRTVSNETCCECQLIRANARYQANKPDGIQRRMANYLANAEREKQKMRDYYAANKDAARQNRIVRYYDNQESARAYSRKWAKENPAARRASHAERRASKRKATPLWLTKDHRSMILAIYKEARRLEEETGIPHHVDHVVPLINPGVCGLHVPWNLQAIPANENLRKSNKVVA